MHLVALVAAAAVAQCIPRIAVTDAKLKAYRADPSELPADASLWAVTTVTDFRNVFKDHAGNPDVTDWDVSSGRFFDGMFSGAANFNRSLAAWDLRSAESFSGLLRGATSYNQPLDIEAPNANDFSELLAGATAMTSSVRIVGGNNDVSFARLLKGATAFNAPLDLNPLEFAGSVEQLLYDAISFNQQLPWSMLNKEAATDLLFANAKAFKWSLGCWSVVPADAPNCSKVATSACIDCTVRKAAASPDRAIYITSLVLVLLAAAYHFTSTAVEA